MFDPGLPRKPIVLLTLGQTIEKLILNEDLVNYMMKRYIVSIQHAMTMTNDLPCRFRYQHEQQLYSLSSKLTNQVKYLVQLS